MKLMWYILASLIVMTSCKNSSSDIVFSKKTNDSNITITLTANKEFQYSAQSTKGAKFFEKGTYTVQDSLLILDYEHEEYTYNCYTIPLPNDTFLLVNYRNSFLLFPLISEIPGVQKKFTYTELMESFVQDYNSKDFSKQIGSHYFLLSKGSIASIHHATYNISPYYDSYITVQ